MHREFLCLQLASPGQRPGEVARTGTRDQELAWHRRQRRTRASARVFLRWGAAAPLLAEAQKSAAGNKHKLHFFKVKMHN